MRRAATLNKGHGRVERRELVASTRGVKQAGWPHLAQFLRLERTTIENGETRTSAAYAITSLPPDRASPEQLLALWRGRWEIESSFWVRDVVLREDASRIRTGGAARSMSRLRNAAINYLRARKVPNTAAALRENALNLEHLLHELGILKQ
jgi:hypothetical protein